MQPSEYDTDFTNRSLDREHSGAPGSGGSSTFNQVKSTVADKLHSAAQSLHQTADRGNQQNLTNFGHQAADWLDRSADYVSQMDPSRMRSDIETQVRRNPGRSLLIAGAVGLVLGGLLRRR